MSTFGAQPNAKADQAAVDKDNPSAEEIAASERTGNDGEGGGGEIPADDAHKPTAILDESQGDTEDRHVASTELPVGDVTDPGTQDDSPAAQEAAEKIVAGAAVGPDPAGVVRNDHGNVAYAPPGSHDAAMNGVQEDASGHVDSVGTDNSSRSGVRI
jgi:hypothetical protein